MRIVFMLFQCRHTFIVELCTIRRHDDTTMFFNTDTSLLKFTLMLHFEFVAQAVPHQCIAHHGAEHRAAAAAEKTTASASPSRLWIQSYPG